MSVKVMADVFDRPDIESPTEKFVLIALVDHADHSGKNIYPSVETVARKTGFSERTVQRATSSLLDAGVLVLDGKGKHQTNKYSYRFYEGDRESPPTENTQRGDSVSKKDGGGVTESPKGGDRESPKPSVNRQEKQEPSVNHAPDGALAKSDKDAIRKIAENKFKEITRLPIPKSGGEANAQWWKPLREMCELAEWHGDSVEHLIQLAIQRMRQSKLNIYSPASILKTTRAVVAESRGGAMGSESARERYYRRMEKING